MLELLLMQLYACEGLGPWRAALHENLIKLIEKKIKIPDIYE